MRYSTHNSQGTEAQRESVDHNSQGIQHMY